MNIQRLLTLALRDITRVWPGQTPSTDELNEALDTTNEILGNWSHEGLLVPTHTVTQFSLAAGTDAYMIGAGATWNTSGLPIKIKGAVSSLTGFQQGAQVMPMELFEASIVNSIGETASLPLKLGVDNAAPQRNVRLWPVPNDSAAVIQISYWTPLTTVALSDTVSFALPGFEEALRNELALRLAATFKTPVPPDLAANAQSSKQALARIDPSEIVEPAPRPVTPAAQ